MDIESFGSNFFDYPVYPNDETYHSNAGFLGPKSCVAITKI